MTRARKRLAAHARGAPLRLARRRAAAAEPLPRRHSRAAVVDARSACAATALRPARSIDRCSTGSTAAHRVARRRAEPASCATWGRALAPGDRVRHPYFGEGRLDDRQGAGPHVARHRRLRRARPQAAASAPTPAWSASREVPKNPSAWLLVSAEAATAAQGAARGRRRRRRSQRDGAELRLADRSLSAQHCRVEPTGAGWKVVDLDSRNGTFVNDALVKQRLLEEGDRIRLGRSSLEFHESDDDLACSRR